MDLTKRVIVPLLVLQAITIAVMLSLNSLNSTSEGIFAVFLSTDLISFAIIAHIYRVFRAGESPSRYFLIPALAAILVLLFSCLTLA
jgi:hypothetical protein